MSNHNFYQSGPSTVIPNSFDSTMANGTCNPQSPSDYVLANPRTAGQVTLTLATDPTDDDVLTVTVTNPVLPSGAVSVNFTASSDTVETSAERLAGLLTSNSILQQYDIFATSLSGVITFNQLGPISQFTVVSAASTGSTTFTLSPVTGVPAGGAGPAFPFRNADVQVNGSNIRLRYGIPLNLTYPQMAAVVQSGTSLK